MRFGAESWLEALWLLPIVAIVLGFAIRRAGAMLQRFIDRDLQTRVGVSSSAARRAVKGILLLAAAAALIIALARPQWNARPREVSVLGRDVCFVIDVSRSMLAEDLAPNRLERAKLWMKDVVTILRGDRVALVAFAGSAAVKCPLTNDYAFFRQSIEELSPASVARGGTLIGDAVRVALDEVFERDATYKDIILITDGEDQESFPLEAAKEAAERNVRIIAIGVGSEGEGKPIPITDDRGRRTFVMYDGKQVLSRLDGVTLRQMALATKDGRYLNVATGTIELDRVYKQFIQEQAQNEMKSKDSIQYDEHFQLFLGAAIALLLIEGLTGERRRST